MKLTVMCKRILKNREMINAGWIIGGRVLNKILAFIVGILTANYLGPSNYGLISYATSYTTFFASLCSLGINSVIIKDFVEHPKEQGEAIGTSLLMRAVSSLLSVIMIAGIVSAADRGEKTTLVVVILCSLGLLFQIFDTLNCWFQSRLESKYPATVAIFSYALVSAVKIILLIQKRNVYWFAAAASIEYFITALFLVFIYVKKNGPALTVSFRKGRSLLSRSNSFIIAGLMVSVYASVDKLMLRHMLDDSAVGNYAIAVSLSTTWAFVLSAIIDSLSPGIMKMHQENREVYERKNRRLYAIVFYTSCAVSFVICLFADPIIHILYRNAYEGAVVPLRIVVWYTAFSYLGVARNTWMVCENKQKYLTGLYAAAALLNVIMNAFLIPVWGGAGAALASLITQISTTMIIPLFIKELRPNTRMLVDAILLRDIL